MKKLVFVILLLALGSAAGIVGYRRVLAQDKVAAVGALRLHGNIDLRDAQLAFFEAERIGTLLVEEGDRVISGQVLATQHTERLQAEIATAEARQRAQQAVVDRLEHGTRPEEIEQAKAAVAAAKVQVTNAQQVIARAESTAASGASSAQELDNDKATLAVAEAELRVREQALLLANAGPRNEDKAQAHAALDAIGAELTLLHCRLADRELHAPSPGIIRTRLLEVGEMASPQRAVFTLALSDPKWVRAYVPEPDLGRVQNGMRATIRSDSFGGRSYEGWVGFVSPVAEFTPKAVETDELRTRLVYEVRVFVHDADGELPLGMPVTVDVDSEGGTGHAPAEHR